MVPFRAALAVLLATPAIAAPLFAVPDGALYILTDDEAKHGRLLRLTPRSSRPLG